MTVKTKIQEAMETPQSKKEVEAGIRRIGDLLSEISQMENNLSKTVQRMTAAASKMASHREQEIVKIQLAIEAFMASHRQELTQGGKTKSIKLPAGRTGWRLSSSSVEIMGEEEEMAKQLEKMGLNGLVRIKRTVDKEAVKKNPGLVQEVKGLIVRKGKEIFWIEPARIGLKTEIAEDGRLVRRKSGAKKD